MKSAILGREAEPIANFHRYLFDIIPIVTPTPSRILSDLAIGRHRYLVGIGSNIDAEKNVPLAIEKLRPHVTKCILSRAIQTDPVGMVSNLKFLNMIAYVESDLDATELKERFNGIEAELGRDRSDPNRKVKDRPIDLDIWIGINSDEDWLKSINEASEYSRLILLELLSYVPHKLTSLDSITVSLQIDSVNYGHRPTPLTMPEFSVH